MNLPSELTPVVYECRFCKKGGIAYYDPACEKLRLEKWTAMLSCNRCADFYAKRNRMTESIWKTCYSLAVILDGNSDGNARAEALRISREKFNSKTRLFAAIVCDFYHKMTVWEPEFTQLLLDAPRKCHQILNDYQRGISGIK